MKHILISLAVAALIAGPAHAACYAEYKSKSDNPFQLYYNVAQISGPCTVASASAQLSRQLAAQGQTLLKVLSVREE
ncbi:hypothetical protein OO012_13210 [Rhodobacteraceae bacterium KMM 6894]|nr:hypothetical protein [Rhodobacteraceae bacterium KMM 6894]